MKSFDEFINWGLLKFEIMNQISKKIIRIDPEIVSMIEQFFDNEDSNYFNNVDVSMLSGYIS